MELIFSKFIKRKKPLYDSIVPLGFNCQLAFNISRVHSYLESNLFNWVFVLDENRFLKTLDNLDLIFSNGYTYRKDTNMFECLVTGIVFHGKQTVDNIKNDNIEIYNANIETEYNDLLGRTKHLITKFKILMNSHKRKCFMYVIESKRLGIEQSVNFINSLYNMLLSKTSNFDLVIICDKESYNDIICNSNKNVIYRKIEKLAPISATTDEKQTDIIGWNKILDEFQVKIPDGYKKKKYKFEKEKENAK